MDHNNGAAIANSMEHQATVEKGLKMKIKRLKPGPSSSTSTSNNGLKKKKLPLQPPVVIDTSTSTSQATNHSTSNGVSETLTKDSFTTMGLHMVPTSGANGQGPCEPGTSVALEGVVWQETDGGM